MRTGGRITLIKNKCVCLSALVDIRKRLRRQGKRVVFTNGCFDIIHYGHAQYLEDARRLGDILIVAVNSDASIQRIKGPKRPIVCQHDRIRTLAALESVSYVVPFNEDTPLETIQKLKPDILVKGADWNKKNIVGADVVKRGGGKVVTIKLVNGRSTTNIIGRIIETHAKDMHQ
ncbi:MAG TPA: D-glycero-beta-D-manno-heptose 1-phosphate adenylyltransferase [Candidatus Omnitrophota bacterium]|nr:D-glycero-beta-D-manno-heptose 1-phosphate adenylyltransferase [Candidatus Omnitrophota bacterium]HPT07634.1 D-glycero-beta-D-manno-heptose 1-phosphate adenylyltransferase [Candidatus Omnitrophota bacterium]